MELERFSPESCAGGELRAQHLSRYEFASSFTQGKRVIDVACGTGYGTSLLRRRGAAVVTGIDLSEEAISHAKGRYAGEGITFLCGDVSLVGTAGPAECVVSFETIEHLGDPETLLEPVRRVLGPGGVFIVSTPVRRGGSISDRPANPFHVREWNQEEFDRLLSRHFPVRKFSHQYVYRKRPYPLSRTLNRLALRMLYPGRSAGFDRFPVVDRSWGFPDALVERGYMIVACSGKGG
jgi:SAM-dependent methyltransferase